MPVKVPIQTTADLAGIEQVKKGLKDLASQSSELKGALAAGFGFGAANALASSVTRITASMVDSVKASVAYNASLEQQTVSFKTLLGSMDLAKARLADLNKFAADTPFQLPEVVQASRVLQSLTKGVLAAGDGLRLVGDAASAAGQPFQEVAMWIGRMYAGLESGQPIGEATMRLMEMGLVSGTVKQRLEDMANAGALGSVRALEVLKTTFASTSGAMIEQSTTLSGLWSTMKDTASQTSGEWFQPLTNGLKEALKWALQLKGALPSDADLLTAKNKASIGAVQSSIASAASTKEELANIERIKSLMADQSKIFDAKGNQGTVNRAGVRSYKPEVQAARDQYAALQQELAKYKMGGEGQTFAAQNSARVQQDASDAQHAKLAKEAAEWVQKDGKALADKNALAMLENETNSRQLAALQVMRSAEASEITDKMDAARSVGEMQKAELTGKAALLDYDKRIAEVKKKIHEEVDAGILKDLDNQKSLAEEILSIDKSNFTLKLAAEERLLKLKDQQITAAKAVVANDFRLTDVQKREREKALLAQENANLGGQISNLNSDMGPFDPATDQLRKQRLTALQDRQAGVQGQLGGLNTQADPNSVGQQMTAQMTILQSQWGTMAQQMGQTFATVIGSAVSSVTNGITGLIEGTKTWGEALRSIGSSVMHTIIQSIVEMGVKWFVTHVFMEGIATGFAAFMSLLGAKETAQTISRETSKTPVLATNAALASVSSWGTALLAIAALGVLIAAFSGGFKEGGYTGSGDSNEVAGVVHKGEFVIPADRVKEFGVNYWENQAFAEAPKGGGGGGGSSRGDSTPGSNNVSFAVMHSDTAMREWMKSQEGRKVFVDLARQHYHEFA